MCFEILRYTRKCWLCSICSIKIHAQYWESSFSYQFIWVKIMLNNKHFLTNIYFILLNRERKFTMMLCTCKLNEIACKVLTLDYVQIYNFVFIKYKQIGCNQWIIRFLKILFRTFAKLYNFRYLDHSPYITRTFCKKLFFYGINQRSVWKVLKMCLIGRSIFFFSNRVKLCLPTSTNVKGRYNTRMKCF